MKLEFPTTSTKSSYLKYLCLKSSILAAVFCVATANLASASELAKCQSMRVLKVSDNFMYEILQTQIDFVIKNKSQQIEAKIYNAGELLESTSDVEVETATREVFLKEQLSEAEILDILDLLQLDSDLSQIEEVRTFSINQRQSSKGRKYILIDFYDKSGTIFLKLTLAGIRTLGYCPVAN